MPYNAEAQAELIRLDDRALAARFLQHLTDAQLLMALLRERDHSIGFDPHAFPGSFGVSVIAPGEVIAHGRGAVCHCLED